MRDKKIVFLFVIFAFLLTFPTTLFAQNTLSQTFTSSDGKFSIHYPESWKVTVESDGLIRFNGNEGFIQISFYDNNNSGYAPVTAMELLEVGIGEDADSRALLGYTEPEEAVIAGYSTLVSRSNDAGQINSVMDFGNGVISQIYGYGQVSVLEPIMKAMMETIQYGDGPKPIVKSSLDDLTPITVANASNVAQIMTLGDENIAVESVAFSPDGKLLAVGTSDGNVQLWDAATGKSQAVLKGNSGGATSLAFDSGGYSLAVGTGSGQVKLWDPLSGELQSTLQEHPARVESVSFVPDGFLIASGAVDGSVKMWDMIAGKARADLAGSDAKTPVGSVVFSPDGKMLAVGGGSTIRLWDVDADSPKATLKTDIGEISSLSFRPDSSLLIYGGADGAAWVWDLKDDNHALLEGHNQRVLALAFSPDGTLVASGDSGTLQLWDATAGKNLAALASPAKQDVNSVAFSPDGTLVASGGPTGGVVLWGTSTVSGDTSQADAPQNSDAATTEETTTSTASCSITASQNANLRSGPGTEFGRAGTLSGGQTTEINGQAKGADGMVWYQLANEAWVRSDVIGSPTDCANVPVITP